MRNRWPTRTLQSLCDDFKQDIVDGPFGSDLQRKDYIGEGVPVLKLQNIKPFAITLKNMDYVSPAKFEELRRHSYSAGDIVMTKLGSPLGVSAIVKDLDDGVIVADIVRIRAQRVNTKYLCYHLNSQRTSDFINSMQKGTTRPRIRLSVVRELPIVVPPQEEQQRIVGILDEAFDGIATAKANAEKNLQNARALFESHLNSVFDQKRNGWKMERIGELTDLARGHNPPKSKFSRERKPGYVRFYQIRDGGTDDYTVYVPDTPQLHKMKPDDIMMVAYRHVGRAFRGVEGAFNVALCKISNARRDLLDDDFLFHLIPSRYVKGELLKRSERSLIPSMSIEHLRELQIPLPLLGEQHRIVEVIKSLAETQRLESIYRQKLAALEALKKSLLDRAFTGDL